MENMKYPIMTKDWLQEKYWDEGMSSLAIGKLLGCSGTTVIKRLRVYGIEVREASNKKLTDDFEAFVRYFYQTKVVPATEIAEILAVSHDAVCKFMIRKDIRTKRDRRGNHTDSHMSDLDKDEIRRLYWDENMSANGIAKLLGCSSSKIYRFMKKHRIPMRSRVEAQKVVLRSGHNSSCWKGRRVDSYGYVYLNKKMLSEGEQKKFQSMFMGAGKSYIAEHRLVVARRLDRPLTSKEHVHHIDQDTSNNNGGNLVLLNASSHSRVNHFAPEAKGILSKFLLYAYRFFSKRLLLRAS